MVTMAIIRSAMAITTAAPTATAVLEDLPAD
jgi:hypothetical protein